MRLTKWIVCAGMLVFTGCHGMTIKPMPERLPEEEQSRWDEAWGNFAEAAPNISREELLDVLLFRQAWHVGVDTLEMRSVKFIGPYMIVMETSYDRSRPDDDAFIVTFINAGGFTVRTERYGANEIGAAIDTFTAHIETSDDETPEEAAKRAALRVEQSRRNARMIELFPIIGADREAESDESGDSGPLDTAP